MQRSQREAPRASAARLPEGEQTAKPSFLNGSFTPALEHGRPLDPDGRGDREPLLSDPAAWLSLFNPGGGEVAAEGREAPTLAPARPVQAELALLCEQWVRRVGWGGDARRAAMRLEIGAGRYAGAELVIVAEAAQVSVELSVPGKPALDLAERLRQRLQQRGFGADVTLR